MVARVAANNLAAVLEDLELHLTSRFVRQVVVDDAARRRILTRRQLRWPRRRIVRGEADAHGRRRLEEIRALRGAGFGGLTKRREIVEDPEAAPVRSRDQIGAEAGGIILHL